MHRVNMPTALPLAEDLYDIAVKNIKLVGTTVEGVVCMHILAFKNGLLCASRSTSGRQH